MACLPYPHPWAPEFLEWRCTIFCHLPLLAQDSASGWAPGVTCLPTQSLKGTEDVIPGRGLVCPWDGLDPTQQELPSGRGPLQAVF